MRELLLKVVGPLNYFVLLSQFQWYRRLYGGHWERWWVECCNTYVWLDIDQCSKTRPLVPFDETRGFDDWIVHYTEYTGRPAPLCRGTPTCEEWS